MEQKSKTTDWYRNTEKICSYNNTTTTIFTHKAYGILQTSTSTVSTSWLNGELLLPTETSAIGASSSSWTQTHRRIFLSSLLKMIRRRLMATPLSFYSPSSYLYQTENGIGTADCPVLFRSRWDEIRSDTMRCERGFMSHVIVWCSMSIIGWDALCLQATTTSTLESPGALSNVVRRWPSMADAECRPKVVAVSPTTTLVRSGLLSVRWDLLWSTSTPIMKFYLHT